MACLHRYQAIYAYLLSIGPLETNSRYLFTDA